MVGMAAFGCHAPIRVPRSESRMFPSSPAGMFGPVLCIEMETLAMPAFLTALTVEIAQPVAAVRTEAPVAVMAGRLAVPVTVRLVVVTPGAVSAPVLSKLVTRLLALSRILKGAAVWEAAILRSRMFADGVEQFRSMVPLV